MPSPETTGRDPVRITVAAHETERLVLENLNLALAGGRAVFERSRVEVAWASANETLRIWEKHGIRQAGFWTTLIGKSSQEITYMLAWDSMAEREKRWGAFLADPEWVAVVAKTEKDGQLVENISSQLLAPVAFSAVK